MDIQNTNVSSIKPGKYIMMDGTVCQVTNVDVSRPGKHGHAKYRITATDILTGQKKQEVYTGHDKVGVPIIEKKNAQVLSVSEDKAQLMDMETYETFEADIPEEFKGKLEANTTVVFWEILDKKVIKQIKAAE